MSLTLYYHPLASYCHKVLIALYESGTAFERRVIDLGSAADRAELQAVFPMCKFPVIRDDARGRSVPESTIIIEYLDRHFPGRHRLIPTGWVEAMEVRLWDRIFDNYVHGPMQQIVADRLHGVNGDLTGLRSTLASAYEMIDRQVASRNWVTGDSFSMADCAAAPALFYAAIVHPIPDELGHLRGYFDRLMERPSCKRVIEEARPYFSMFPFAEAIPQRFLAA